MVVVNAQIKTLIDNTIGEIEDLRQRGADVTDLELTTRNGRVFGSYIVKGSAGYKVEIDFTAREWRHCGFGAGTFWTDWEPF